MVNENIKKTIKDALLRMDCYNINFEEKEDAFVVTFDCHQLTSFKETVPGWIYTGTRLNIGGNGQFAIDFQKNS